MIKGITESTGAQIDVLDDGTVNVLALNQEVMEAARKQIEAITADVEIDKIYQGMVKSVKEFGAFVEILPGKEGLVHISQLDTKRVEKVEDLFKVGDTMEVKLMQIDPEGKLSLSRKATMPGGENAEEEMDRARERRKSAPHRPRSDHGRR